MGSEVDAVLFEGNSLSLATVDVSAAYVGLRTHQPTIAGVLLTLYTYAGPLFWQMAYLTRFSLPGDLERHVTTSLACFRLGFVLLPITFCATSGSKTDAVVYLARSVTSAEDEKASTVDLLPMTAIMLLTALTKNDFMKTGAEQSPVKTSEELNSSQYRLKYTIMWAASEQSVNLIIDKV
ncbi:hypothetical protein X801_01933 [Opisthorchis viverrini]|uniref:GPI ethanolamine phosphate transferase 2 C-terminal domain-containing protein n=1 Tax=Opisthorchis viverrini TaxID=6198 RepID=A0A1S8X6T4_OPIVI|nr:hypothetical protein X801_01933 [Opisthorchis viverrini]